MNSFEKKVLNFMLWLKTIEMLKNKNYRNVYIHKKRAKVYKGWRNVSVFR